VVIPFFAVASIYGTKRLLSHTGKLNWKRISSLLMISALTFSIWAVVSFQFPISFDAGYAERVNRAINLIPGNASILTINSFEPHVSSRYNVWVLPLSYTEPYVGFDTGIADIWKEYTPNFLETKEPDFILWDVNRGGVEAYNLNLTIQDLLSRVHYGVYAFLDGILLLKKGYDGAPLIYEIADRTYNYANLTIYPPCQTIDDSSSRSGRVLFCNDTENETFLEAAPIFLPNGNYTIKMGIRVSGITNETTNVFMLQANMGNRYLNFTLSANNVTENEWKEFNLDFEVKNALACVSLKGATLNSRVELYIDYIDIHPVINNEGK
jgi:hypothetical protein